jgi:hypothetical protein
MIRKTLAGLVFGLAAASALAQALPNEISGRWYWKARNVGQAFTLEDLRQVEGNGVTARLTWWTMETRCALRGEPVRGTVVDGVLNFEAKTRCDVGFKLALKAEGAGWTGTATTTTTPTPLVMEVTGK